MLEPEAQMLSTSFDDINPASPTDIVTAICFRGLVYKVMQKLCGQQLDPPGPGRPYWSCRTHSSVPMGLWSYMVYTRALK